MLTEIFHIQIMINFVMDVIIVSAKIDKNDCTIILFVLVGGYSDYN